MDRAGKAYWDAAWEREQLPLAVDPTRAGLDNYVTKQFHELFVREFPASRDGLRLLEVGCARSSWLPYFALHHGFEVSGLDYSAGGCEQARRILEGAGVSGQVIEGDLFAPPEGMVGQFDVVVSFGLVEHFTDTVAAHVALARFLKPDGLIVTIIPNLGGSLLSLFQRVLDRAVFDVHEPIDRRQLANAHAQANLQLSWCHYFLSVNWNVLNIASWRNARWRTRLMRIFSGLSKAVWMLERRGFIIPPNRLTSPYIVAVARPLRRR